MVNWALIIGGIGAVTGIVSLGWHILNSRSIVILERVSFTRARRHTHKETIDIEANIRNKSNHATTIEGIYLHFGNRWIPMNYGQPIKIEPNSSHPLKLHQHFSLDEFKEILKDSEGKEVKLGIEIIHTFGTLKKISSTDFSTDWLSIW